REGPRGDPVQRRRHRCRRPGCSVLEQAEVGHHHVMVGSADPHDADPDRLYARTDEMVDSQETGTHRETPRPVRPPQARGGQQIRPATGETAIYLPYRRRVEVAGY